MSVRWKSKKFAAILAPMALVALVTVISVYALTQSNSHLEITIPQPSTTIRHNGMYVLAYVYSPREVNVRSGTMISWVNQDSVPHTVTSVDGSFDSGSLSRGRTFALQANESGVYDYYCKFHPWMVGKITVK